MFTVVPIIASVVLAFFRWDIITATPVRRRRQLRRPRRRPHRAGVVPQHLRLRRRRRVLQLAVALGLAILVQSRMPDWLRAFFRSALFFPLILSAASVSLVMAYLFNQDFGLVNQVLNAVRDRPDVGWLTTASGRNGRRPGRLRLAELRVLVPAVHRRPGRDPAGRLRGRLDRRRHRLAQFRHVTLPLLSPTMLVASVMAIISALQIFDQPYVLTRGGPGDSTRTAVMVIYESAFQQLEFGRASAIGIILTLIIMRRHRRCSSASAALRLLPVRSGMMTIATTAATSQPAEPRHRRRPGARSP